jgi:excisionase family DNA binding protein
MAITITPEVLTVEEAASLLRISRGSAYEAVRRGDLPVLRIGRRLLVPRKRLEELLAHGLHDR